MKKLSLIVMVIAATVCVGCSGDDNSTGTGPTPVVSDTLYVDFSHTGLEDGSQSRPFNTLTEAVSAASEGSLLLVAAGEYTNEEEFIRLKGGMTVRGVHADLTRIMTTFLGPLDNDPRPVTLEDLHCQGFFYGIAEADEEPPGTCALRRCHIEGEVAMMHGGGYSLTLDSCAVTEGIRFGHGSCDWFSRDAVR
jgi:hypothetical protein